MSRREMQYVCCMSDENITPIDLACDKEKTVTCFLLLVYSVFLFFTYVTVCTLTRTK